METIRLLPALALSFLAAACSPVAADSLEVMGPYEQPLATHAAYDVSYDRRIGSNATCPVQKQGLGIQGGSFDTCHYSTDGLDLLDKWCDSDACSFEPSAVAGAVRVRVARAGSVTVHVRARSKSDGKTIEGATTFSVVDAATVSVDPPASNEPGASAGPRLEQFPLGIGMSITRSVVARSNAGEELAGEPELTPSANVQADWKDERLTARTTAVGHATVDVAVGDAKTTMAFDVVDVGSSKLELHEMSGHALAPEPATAIDLTLAKGPASSIPYVACARTEDGQLAVVAPPALEIRADSDGYFIVDTAPGVVSLSAIEAGSAELWAPGYRVATLTAK